MNLASAIAIYFIIWWLVLFLVLPFGIRNAHETGETVEEGNEPGAPVKPAPGAEGAYHDDPGNGGVCDFLPGADAGLFEPRQPAILQHDALVNLSNKKRRSFHFALSKSVGLPFSC